jgi:hypothetical protein
VSYDRTPLKNAYGPGHVPSTSMRSTNSRSARLRAAIISLVLLGVSVAFACNGPPPPSVPDAFREADFVVIAKVISIHQQRILHNGLTDVVEKDTFKVLQVFKGRYAPGTLLHYVTTIGIGTCGVSAKGVKAMDKRGKFRRFDFSGTWLLYGNGPEPYELDLMSRTAPMEYGGDAEIKELSRLATVEGGSQEQNK